MDVFKYFRIIFDVVVVLSLEVLLSLYSPYDSLLLPIKEKMRVYMVRSYDDKNATCIQFRAKSYDLNALMCGYGSKGHSAPSFNMILGYSSFIMEQYSREFNFPMVAVVKEACWRIFFTFHGMLNFVLTEASFGVKERVGSKGFICQPCSINNILSNPVITCSHIPHYFTQWDPRGWSLVHWRIHHAWEALYHNENSGSSSSGVEETDVGGFL